jgi:hypothetical protein
MERARFIAVQTIFYNINRRDCWAYVQAKAPWDIKRIVWEHEKDELFHDPRGGSDHLVLTSKEAIALGVSEASLSTAQPTPLLEAVLRGFTHAAMSQPWLGALTTSHFLERRNNSNLIPGGAFSERLREKMVSELGVARESLVSSNVHVEADIDHSDAVWEAIARSTKTACDYEVALEGGRTCVILDRAYRAALGHEIRQLP